MDNLSLHEAYDYDRETRLEKRMICDKCGNRIFDDHYFDLDGERLCEDCIDEHLAELKEEIRRPIYDV